MVIPRPLPDGPLYFSGIGGAGMSALALVLAQRGFVVRGADPGVSSAVKERLEAAGCVVYQKHDPAQLGDCVALIATDAVKEDNPELVFATQNQIPIFRRPEALGWLVNQTKTSICVAGTHGKTTTTAMIASILIHAGKNPTVLIGGDLPLIGGNARNGDPDLIVVEACEAYGGLDWLTPSIAVITNCEPDHLDFHGSAKNFYAAFERFIESSSTIVLCESLPSAVESAKKLDVEKAQHFSLHVPGEHNQRNALGAAAAARHLGVSSEQIVSGLESFTGTGRRFEVLGEFDGITVVDDYAHHPTEIKATLQAARQAYPNRRVVAIYQPHLPSRTRDFLSEFASALSENADLVFLTDIYLAREPEQPGLIETLSEQANATLVKDKTQLVGILAKQLRNGDIALYMGAGNIREEAEAYLRYLSKR